VDDEVLVLVVETAGEVRVEDGLCALCVALLRVDRGARHVGDHGVASAPGVLCVAERVVLGRGLGEPDVAAVAAELAGLEGFGDVLLDDDGAAGCVDEPGALLHLGEEVLVEEAARLLVERAVDGHDVALREHLLKAVDAAAADLSLLLGGQRLVVEVEQLLAVEGFEAAEHTLTDAADGDGTHDLVLEVVLILGNGSDVPVASGNLLVGGDEVADKDQDGHDDVLSDGHDVGAGDLGNGNTAIGLVGGVQVDVVGADTSSHSKLQLLRLGETLSSEVAGVEAADPSLAHVQFPNLSQVWGFGGAGCVRKRACGVGRHEELRLTEW
jgi:hypothetical protein